MKRFARSVAGKTTLFITFTLCLCILLGCVAAAFVIINENFYETTEDEYVHLMRSDFISTKIFIYLQDKLIFQNDNALLLSSYGIETEVRMTDDDGITVIKTEGYADASKDPDYDKFELEYLISLNDEGKIVDIERIYYQQHYSPHQGKLIVTAYSDRNIEVFEGETLIKKAIHIAYSLKFAVYPIALALIIICVVIFITLMCTAGRKPGTDELQPGPFFKIPFDIVLAAVFFIFLGAVYIIDSLMLSDEIVILLIGLIVFIVCINVFLGLSMSFASRVKQHVLIKGTLIYKVLYLVFRIIRKIIFGIIRGAAALFNFLKNIFRGIPMIWRGALVVLGICLIDLIFTLACRWEPDNLMIFWTIEHIILVPAVIFAIITMSKLQKGAENIASGNLTYKTDTKGLYWDFKRHAENLNSISAGMAQAVEKQLKSERMKTELITNVSHDIKTPLTSIINYASLISEEKCDNQRINEYSDVLLRQSQKLKRLIEDLVEASKASTGNLEVSLVPCDAAVFITQAGGEYEEKIASAGLSLITKIPEHEVKIFADSRKMWRVFDNLMNNICKYSQPGTRVYLSLEAIHNNAVITFKNTSRDPLDISADELMERFVRGDASRNTEGNGLGLSIARSLIELQGGSFDLDVDGDLFKVTIKFPMI